MHVIHYTGILFWSQWLCASVTLYTLTLYCIMSNICIIIIMYNVCIMWYNYACYAHYTGIWSQWLCASVTLYTLTLYYV